MRGRKPTPTKLKQLKGNPGRRPLNKNEPDPAVFMPDMPKFTNPETIAEWEREVPELHALGLVTTSSVGSLFRTYERLDDYWTLRKAILKEGWTIEKRGSRGQKIQAVNPKVPLMEKAWKDVMDGRRGFGGDPSSMSRVTCAQKEEPKKAELIAFAGGKK